MADVHVQSYGTFASNVFSGTPSPLPRPYLPSLPPSKTIKPSYSRFLIEAPYSALAGVVADARDPPKPPLLPRSRNRIQVGCTNRWRLPSVLGSDLLGSSQALKSVNSSYNDTIRAVMTADCPRVACNHLDEGREKSSQTPVHTVISPRFLKSQPAPGLTTSTRDLDQRLVQSQPVAFSVLPRRELGNSELSPFHLKQIDYQRNVISPAMRCPTPMELFLLRSQVVGAHKIPDVVVHALDNSWELHKPYLQKSWLLSSMLKKAQMTGMRNIEEEDEEDSTSGGGEIGSSLDALKTAASHGSMEPVAANLSQSSLGRRRSSIEWFKNKLTLKLRIKDPLITKQTFALALAALYENESEMTVTEADAVGVLAAANFLGFSSLEKLCADVMLRSIAAWSVCAFHASASKYKQNSVVEACERWLELNLIPQLSVQIYLSHLPQDLLEKCLKSTKLFTWSEYSLYKLLAYWIFLQQHPNLQMMPSWGTVVTWFMSLPKGTSFLEREEGHGYVSLFRTVRLSGITDSSQLDELQKMNLIPQSWLLRVYTQHYHALQGGGDMSLMTRFEHGAIRKGFILEEHLKYHSEIVSVHGFHFEVKAAKDADTDSKYLFYLQRLKPNDPVLSFRACERHTFSMRHDREVRYCIRVQWFDCGLNKIFTSGILCHSFGLSGKTRQSEVVSVEDVCMPLYVSVSLMFPPS
ncbi:BTB/POZ domain-containing protein 16-like [Acropora millepora]|uniref:BTB/POZ domain-containing protein 16-like n=1 Tax=Acropora millepora TaxID=45264 RepID=UPI001CF18ACD|nr:BTB/POZ domain-containing protein 16-like [Acropora millepora]